MILFNKKLKCPYCKSDDLEFNDIVNDDNNVIKINWICNDCNKGENGFDVIYKLNKIIK